MSDKSRSMIVSICASFSLMLGCDLSFLDSPEEKSARIRAMIEDQQFSEADEILQSAQESVVEGDRDVIRYNIAMLKILEGQCEEAQKTMNELTLQHGEIDNAGYVDVTERTKNDRHAYIYLGAALAELCPREKGAHLEEASLKRILDNLYKAQRLGVDVKDLISTVVHIQIPECSFFVSEEQRPAVAFENALSVSKSEISELVVCSDGVWLKASGREHEKLWAEIDLKPLDRKIWLDDSSRLPFSQFHVELLEEPEDGVTFKAPLRSYEQAIPISLPSEKDYQQMHISLAEVELKKTGTYYIHIYTQNNGETNASISFGKNIDCGHIDDLVTYDAELHQKTVDMHSGDRLDKLFLCPSRPDLFKFELEPGQKALFQIYVEKHDNKEDPGISIGVMDERNRQLTVLSEGGVEPVQTPEVLVFRENPETAAEKKEQEVAVMALVQNVTNELHTYQMQLGANRAKDAFGYHILMSSSESCDQAQEREVIPIPLEEIEKTGGIYLPAQWFCPGQTRDYRPLLSSQMPILKSSVNFDFVSTDRIHPGDIAFESYVHMDDNGDYRVERGMETVGKWTHSDYSISYQLQKPLTSNTIIRGRTSEGLSGFSLISIYLNDNSDDNSEKSEESSEDEKKKEEAKEQKDKNKEQESPKDSPDKPSESPAAKGAGEDTSGDESKPDENAAGNKTSKFDMKQYEEDYIDSLLDVIERGQFAAPFSGNVEERGSDKDW